MKTKYRGGILRAVSVALAGTLIAVGGAAGAQAATGKPVIDPNQKGSITIHKLEYPDEALDLPANGMDQGTIAGATPMKDVTFEVKKVSGYDLSLNADWLRLKDLTPAGAAAGQFDLVQEYTTLGDGLAYFGELPVGVYLVTETGYPAGVTPVDPFLITVPLTNPANDAEWVYNVHVYPKNAITNGTKTVDDDKSVKLGDKIEFTIKADIPNVEVIDGYKIVDELDSKLTYVGAEVTLTKDAAIVKDLDYTIVHNNGVVTVQFTDDGLLKLAANPDAQVQVVITTTVNAIGEIENVAVVYPNAPSFEIEPGKPGGPTVTPEVVTKWGAIDLLKVNQKGAPLGGAKFSVYLSEADAKNGDNPVSINGVTVFETDDTEGTVRISGLRYSDWADGATVEPGDPEYRTYWLAEVEAPAGYELLAHPVSFLVTAETTTVDVDKTIENVPSNGGFDLPLTGGMGTVAITTAGVLLLAGALFLAIRSRRRETTNG